MNNIIDVLEKYDIPYKLKGKNISKKSDLGICCPFCEDDIGFHLGIKGNNYSCWKNENHKGNTITLIKKLLGCSYFDAIAELKYISIADDDEMMRAINRLFKNTNNDTKHCNNLVFPSTFCPITDRGSTKKFFYYLESRGFEYHDIVNLIEYYKLQCDLIGDYNYRVIIPIYEKGQLITWVGRSIEKNCSLPYKAVPESLSVKITTNCLFDYDNIIEGGDTLFICEGVFDAMKINWYTDESIKATCLFTKRMSAMQQSLLLDLIPRYKQILILLDSDAYIDAKNIYEEIKWMSNNIKISLLPKIYKDPGIMNKEQIKNLIKGIYDGFKNNTRTRLL